MAKRKKIKECNEEIDVSVFKNNLRDNIEKRLLNPIPGSAIEAARNFGTDLTLLIEQLRLTPEERLQRLQKTITTLNQIRGAVRNAR